MSTNYDKYYLTSDLFGEPYVELIRFFEEFPVKGKLLDVGCGQGRNAIPLGRMGYAVIGIDHSIVGITQMNEVSRKEGINARGLVGDIFEFNEYGDYDAILLDSMFHFSKKDKRQELNLILHILREVKEKAIIVFCIQNVGEKVNVLNAVISDTLLADKIYESDFQYKFSDKKSNHTSVTPYKMMVVQKRQ